MTVIWLSSLTGGASAEISATQAWESVKSQLALLGDVAAQENVSGNVLTISDMSFVAADGDVTGEAALTGEIKFTENSDGTVTVDIPNGLTGRVSLDGPIGLATFDYSFTPEGLSALASGEDGQILYTIEAGRLVHSFSNIKIDGEESFGASFELGMTGVNGGWSRDTMQSESNITASYRYDQVKVTGEINDADIGPVLDVNAVGLGLAVGADISVPEDLALDGTSGFLTSGLRFSSKTSYETFSYDLDGRGMSAKANMGAGFIEASLDGDALDYATEVTDLQVSANAGVFLPQIDFSLATSTSRLRATLPAPGETQEIASQFAYREARLGDGLWGLFDPQGVLPREPVNMFFETEAEGGIDYLKDAAPLTYLLLKSRTPQPLQSITIKEIFVTAAGAELQGQGAFTFDNADLESFGGIPRPKGSLDLQMSGAFGLLDNLAKAGLLPDAQAQGIKSMAGFFAKPGPTPDSLTSKIEITDEGRILANGVPLQ
ncbi:MAG: DUF2125 domain-containing protein [Pseudomonadota bacterium]